MGFPGGFVVSFFLAISFVAMGGYQPLGLVVTSIFVTAVLGGMLGLAMGKCKELRRELKREELFRSFVQEFISRDAYQLAVDERLQELALAFDKAVQEALKFQKGGLYAIDPGLCDSNLDEDAYQKSFDRAKENLESHIQSFKALFWRTYDIAEAGPREFPGAFNVRVRPRSYKNYLPDDV